MTNLTPVSSFDPVPQLETTTLALGGPGGPMNLPAQALLNRTQWLHDNALAGQAGPFAEGAGTANACTANFVPPITALADGLKLRFTALASNTGPATFAPNALAPAPIVGGGYAALQGGEILANGTVEIVWNSTLSSWVLVAQAGASPQVPDGTQSQHAASKGQVDAVRSDFASSDPAKGSALITVLPIGTSTLAVALRNLLAQANGVPVTLYDTAANLAIDATAATVKAIADARTLGKNAVYFPAGIAYRFAAASASIDPGTTDILFYGDNTVLIFEEGTSTDPNVENRKNLFKNTTNTTKGKVEFRGLHFKGTWSDAAYPSGQGGSSLMLYYYDEVVLQNCRFTNHRSYVMVNEFIKNARVMGCTFDKNARDNCRFRSTFNVQVIGNRFSHCDDDAVALHCNTNVTGGNIREGIVVADNIFEDTSAIQILGGRVVSVRGNILRRCKQNGILIYTAAGVAAEADNGMFGVSVTDNQIYDMLSDYPFSAAVSQAIAVFSRAAEAGTSTGGIIPGQNNPANGTFALPWNSRNTAYTGTVDSVGPLYFVRIQNNTVVRTLPAVAAYSTWGYGSTYAGDGPHDPAVTDAALRVGSGILLSGQVRKAIVSGNVVSHVGNGLSFDVEAGSNFGLDDVLVVSNVFSDFLGDCIAIPSPGSVRTVNLMVADNDFDGDPYHLSTNRGTGGTWLADGSPSVIACTSHSGVQVLRNKIRNVCRVVNNGGGSGTALAGNLLRCAPAAIGFSTSNKGIGNLPEAGVQCIYEHVDSDPTSATYGNLITSVQMMQAAMPTSGTYVRGTFIQAANSSTLLGWKRLTTGSAHVAGTDWKTVVVT